MSVKELEILKFPDPRLQQKSKAVTQFDNSLHELLERMAVTMYSAGGIGLAAPQVNHFERIFIIDLLDDEGSPKKRYEFINPELKEKDGKILFEEGCLSVPGYTEEVKRAAALRVDYQDRNGKKRTLQAKGLLAVAIQHENDHLDGILFLDRLPAIKRGLVKRKLAKAVTL